MAAAGGVVQRPIAAAARSVDRGASGERPGNIYDRDTHEVRVTVTSDRWATRLQYKWIKRYNPRDNDTRGMSIDTNRTIPTKDFDDEVPF